MPMSMTPRPFQQEAVDKLTKPKITSRLLGDEMGLGKTVEAIWIDLKRRTALAKADMDAGGKIKNRKTLIIAPLAVTESWERHLDLLAPSARVVVCNPKRRADFVKALKQPYHYYIIHWEGMRILARDLGRLHWFHIIADEVHRAKNRKAQTTHALKSLSADEKTGCSGTPADDMPMDLWSILNWLWPRYYTSYWRFVKHYCNPPEAPIWMADGTFKPIGEVQVGDKIIGWEKHPVNGRMRLCESEVLETRRRTAPIVKATMESGQTIRCTPDHDWLWGSPDINRPNPWVKMDWPTTRNGHKKSISRIVEVPTEPSVQQKKDALWLGGIYDGEGTCSDMGQMSIAQSSSANPEVHERVGRILEELGFSYRLDSSRQGADVFNLVAPEYRSLFSSKSQTAKFLAWCEPTKRTKVVKKLMTCHFRSKDYVEKIEHEGPGEVVSMRTSTGNYVAWGYASRNCVFETETNWGNGQTYQKFVGVQNARSLQQEMEPWFVRRRKEEVLKDLPEKTYTDVWVDLYPKQRRAYNEMRDDMITWVENNKDKSLPVMAAVVVAQLTRLQQFALGYMEGEQTTRRVRNKETGKVTEEPWVNWTISDPSSKLDAVMEILKDNPGKQFVIFSQFKSVLNLLGTRLSKAKIPHGLYTGDVKKSDRDKLVNDFQAGKVQIFMGTIAAGGEGITLTASDTVIFLDRSWKPSKNRQAEDRVHRIGQQNAVQIIDVMAKDTVDLGRRQRINMKWQWIQEILGDSARVQKGEPKQQWTLNLGAVKE